MKDLNTYVLFDSRSQTVLNLGPAPNEDWKVVNVPGIISRGGIE